VSGQKQDVSGQHQDVSGQHQTHLVWANGQSGNKPKKKEGERERESWHDFCTACNKNMSLILMSSLA